MTTRAGMRGLFVRNAYGKIEAVAVYARQARYEKEIDFPAEVSAIAEKADRPGGCV